MILILFAIFKGVSLESPVHLNLIYTNRVNNDFMKPITSNLVIMNSLAFKIFSFGKLKESGLLRQNIGTSYLFPINVYNKLPFNIFTLIIICHLNCLTY